MNRHGLALPGWLVVLTLSASGAVAAAGAPAPAAQELDEVVVEGLRSKEKPSRPSFQDYQEPFNFLARLVGLFVIDGTVDLHAQGSSKDLIKVSGRAECVGFGIAPGVLCELKVRWPETQGPDGEDIPGGVSTFNPAMMLFGFEPVDPNGSGLMAEVGAMFGGKRGARMARFAPPPEPAQPGVSYVVVDSNGIAETATGVMITPNTMQSRTRCIDIPGNCERLARITAEPDHQMVEMKIDLAMDLQKTVSFSFVMHRVPGSVSVVYGRKPEKKKK